MPTESSLATRILAPNASPMTLEGTNTWIIRAPGSESVTVVDPGPTDRGHLDAIMASGRIELIMATHRHSDHTAALRALGECAGAPVRAFDPAFCSGAEPLLDGEEFAASGVRIQVIATPGHTSDSICLVLPDDSGGGSILTGDTILGKGTSVILLPDGDLRAYLASLELLRSRGGLRVLPGHGPVLPSLSAVCEDYIAHRRVRLDQVRRARDELGTQASAAEIADAVYKDADPALRWAAEASVATQLDYLRATLP